MELLLILNKFILWCYICICYLYSDHINAAWFVFTSLAYLSINMSIYLFKKTQLKYSGIWLSMILILAASFQVDPFFMLLLPMNLYEFFSIYINKKWVLLILLMLPLAVISHSLHPAYFLAASFHFMSVTITEQYVQRAAKLESALDTMRKDIHRLTKSLNDYYEYMKQSQYTLQLEERNRLAQQLHDQIGHAMTGALIQMEAAKRLLDTNSYKAKELLQNAIHISKDGIENIRTTLKHIKPRSEQMGVNRVKLFIEEMAAQHHRHIPLVCKGDLEIITPIQWKVIYENMTEALTNAMKYANATVISIEIHVLNTLIKMEVKDNGKGADKIKKGLGIIGMEERAASVNGTVIVDGTNGFSVTTLLPIQKHEPVQT
ncbi:sensor histidine kinase [Anoxybacteroides rupiense]|uniref:histidine kinase n=1 Tax=Anoxybacteroides rupiense TaxID=311460 RepID=A0ABD5IWR1_9BACL|nr:sensor histidine kinase [Anoxybacillus rupiensis]MBB3907531.1 signal transduction histidine kinase [Anoxybacillus rupiensis]MED5051846.1 sensor histidine kinase [Anoxybacillus rupiensis]